MYRTKHRKAEGDKQYIILSALPFPNSNLNASLWICLMEPDIKLFIPPTRKDQRKMIDEYIHCHLLTSDECMSACLCFCVCVCQVLIWFGTHTRTHMSTYSYTNNRDKINTLLYIFSVRGEFSQNVLCPKDKFMRIKSADTLNKETKYVF